MAGLASALGSIDWMNPEGTKVRHNPEAFLKGAAEWQEKKRKNKLLREMEGAPALPDGEQMRERAVESYLSKMDGYEAALSLA
jgi:hypothetical protein